jgi:hypothetical protein
VGCGIWACVVVLAGMSWRSDSAVKISWAVGLADRSAQ